MTDWVVLVAGIVGWVIAMGVALGTWLHQWSVARRVDEDIRRGIAHRAAIMERMEEALAEISSSADPEEEARRTDAFAKAVADAIHAKVAGTAGAAKQGKPGAIESLEGIISTFKGLRGPDEAPKRVENGRPPGW